jgi:toluene monooxygenase system ferredoxin subunit
MPDKDFLLKFKFLSDISQEALDRIASKCEIREFKPNDTIFRFEDPAEHFYGLIDGEVELSLVFTDRVLKTEVEYEEAVHARIVDQEKQIAVDVVHPGQVFGWASITGSGKRTVTAQCTVKSRIFAIPAADLMAMFDADHSLGYFIMKRMAGIISKRLKNRTDKLIEAWVEAFDVDQI